MAQAIGSFQATNPSVVLILGFDFAAALASGDSILADTQVWACTVTGGEDAAASTRLLGGPQLNGTQTYQKVGYFLPNVTYALAASVNTTLGETLTLWGDDCMRADWHNIAVIVSFGITETQILTALRTALMAVLPAGTPVIKAQVNRVPEVTAADFVIMTPTARKRLSTNVDVEVDVYFTGSIAGTTLTVSEVAYGTIIPNTQLFGVGIADNTLIAKQLTGSPAGGVGTYQLSIAQTVTSEGMASGTKSMTQNTNVTIQLDVHGPNSGDNAQIISTVFRDGYGVGLFQPDVSGVSPLYADDPKQMPFRNENQQVEYREVILCELQVNPTVSVPQQFMDQIAIGIISVDAQYPPT